MRGRTNVGGGGAAEIYADTEIFTVAEGSNVTAGNFVQYKLVSDDRKYDTQYGGTSNSAPKVLPLGNGKYVRRYKNTTEESVTWFNLIDANEGFNLLSSFSINNEYIPAFCLLNDGKLAICYMEKDNAITLKIYDLETSFLQVGSYEFKNESIGEKGWAHMTQTTNSNIIVSNGENYCVLNYNKELVTENFYGKFEKLDNLGDPLNNEDNDWNLYSVGENRFILFEKFQNGSHKRYYVLLYKMNENDISLLQKSFHYDSYELGSKGRNAMTWGNAFGVSENILFTNGYTDNSGEDSIQYWFNTYVYSSENDMVIQSTQINIFNTVVDSFPELNIRVDYSTSTVTSTTAQFVSENEIYVAVCPQAVYFFQDKGGALKNPFNKTAIFRMEYNNISKNFEISNVVTFESKDYYENGAYRGNVQSGYGQFFVNESGEIYYLYETSNNAKNLKSGRWLMKLSYKNGVLSIGESTGLVENYNASGAAIGVAKQSGSAGQEVEVYVPKA